ncbi:MAG: GNAT family N-acetyltransferase/peptidase C39 family protein [Gammaproteobacteria bacterium]
MTRATRARRSPLEATPTIRPAGKPDLAALVALEEAAFDQDRISRRQFRHLLTRANAAVLLALDAHGRTLGDVVLLFSRGTATARLYSIAVHPQARGRGVARALVEAAEAEAWRRERAWMRLEVRKDNRASLGLFESLGYRRFGEHADYYADRMAAWRYEKPLDDRLKPPLARVPYYRQTLDFTCGPAALIMAMKALDPGLRPDRMLELRLWREATTIFMTSGHGGCGPFGLALAAARRGFRVEVIFSAVSLALLEERYAAGAVPIVLISSWQIYEEKSPHWVVVTGFDEHFVYVNDPFVDEDEGEVTADSINMPIGREQFDRMSRYGRKGLQATVFISAGG